MKRAFVFPGQGSQSVGMGKAMAEAYPAARQVFDMVDEALGEKLSTLIFEGQQEELTLTRNAQPALMATAVAALRAIEAESGKSVSEMAAFVAGHSLGEYSALAGANALDVADAARLLRLRGDSMQKAVPVGVGAMAALLGAEIDQAREIAAEAADDACCDIANDNASGQVVVSGDKAAVERAIKIAADKGIKRAIMLPVSAPFHCRLMAPAADVMAEALAGVRLMPPVAPVVANVAAEAVTSPDDIRRLLVEQVTGMVRWREGVLYMASQGLQEQVELGAGKVLTGLAKRIAKDVQGRSIETPDDVRAFVETL